MKKVAKSFYCENCHYICFNKYNFEKHLSTHKHKLLTHTYAKVVNNSKESQKDQEKQFVCVCGKEYKHRQSLFNHKKNCKIILANNNNNNNNNNINNNNINNNNNNNNVYGDNIKNILLKENDDLREQLKEQHKQILELIPKIGNNNNSNNLNINLFLNEQCKDAISINEFITKIEISLKNLLTTKTKGLGIGINEIIKENMNKLSLYERPIHCSDIKGEILYVKNDKWEKDENKIKIRKMLKDVQSEQFKAMQKWIQKHPNYMESEELKHEYILLVNKCSDSLNEHEKKIVKNICDSTYLNDL